MSVAEPQTAAVVHDGVDMHQGRHKVAFASAIDLSGHAALRVDSGSC